MREFSKLQLQERKKEKISTFSQLFQNVVLSIQMKGLLFQRTSSFKGYNLLYFGYFSSPFFSSLSFSTFPHPTGGVSRDFPTGSSPFHGGAVSTSPHLSLQLLFPLLEMDLPWVWAAEKTGAALASTKPLSLGLGLCYLESLCQGEMRSTLPSCLHLLPGAQRLFN